MLVWCIHFMCLPVKTLTNTAVIHCMMIKSMSPLKQYFSSPRKLSASGRLNFAWKAMYWHIFFCKNHWKNKFGYKEAYVKYLFIKTSKADSGHGIVLYSDWDNVMVCLSLSTITFWKILEKINVLRSFAMAQMRIESCYLLRNPGCRLKFWLNTSLIWSIF